MRSIFISAASSVWKQYYELVPSSQGNLLKPRGLPEQAPFCVWETNTSQHELEPRKPIKAGSFQSRRDK